MPQLSGITTQYSASKGNIESDRLNNFTNEKITLDKINTSTFEKTEGLLQKDFQTSLSQPDILRTYIIDPSKNNNRRPRGSKPEEVKKEWVPDNRSSYPMRYAMDSSYHNTPKDDRAKHLNNTLTIPFLKEIKNLAGK